MVSKIVLLKVDTHQNRWPMAKVVQVCPNKHGAVRNIQLLNGSCNGMKKNLEIAMHKIFWFVEAETDSIPQLEYYQIMYSHEISHM